MNNFPKNIFFYWHDKILNDELIINIENYKKTYPDFNIKVLCDEDMDEYYHDFPELCNMYKNINIAACKSDIIRILALYKHGGIYIDLHTTPVPYIPNNGSSIRRLFEKNKHYDVIIPRNYYDNYDMKFTVLISKKEATFLFDVIQIMTKNLRDQYNNEKNANKYISYNIFFITGVVIAYQLLDYYDNFEFREKNKDTLTDLKNFKKYNIAVFDDRYYFTLYGCNMDHHHNGATFEKHWSKLQGRIMLFNHQN